jgi:glycosyltransferase involved in cell wall biosynthesis
MVVFLAEVSADRVIGGAERVLHEQVVGLSRLGCHVGLAVRAPQDDPRPVVTIGGATEHRYLPRRTSEVAYVLSSIRGALRAFDRAVQDRRPDAVVIHQALAGLGPLLWRRTAARAWIYLCHSLAHEEFCSRSRAAQVSHVRFVANALVRRWCERLVMHRCARVVVLSDFMRRRVQEVHGIAAERLELIPGAVDIARFTPATDPARVRQRLGLPADRTILLTVRNLVPRMGLDTLVRAMAHLQVDHPDILALIGGEGPLRGELEGLIHRYALKDHVRLVGFIPEAELARYYQAADLAVLPTAELEGFGLMTIEALACGTPVVGTPVGATPELLRPIDPALVTRDASAEALADTLRTVLARFRQDPRARMRLASRGVAVVRAQYTWDRHCANLLTVCGEAARNQLAT